MAETRAGWDGIRINMAGSVRCEPDWNWIPSPDGFVDFDLWYVWAGSGWVDLFDGNRVEVGPGSALCLRPGQPPRRAEHHRADRLGVCFVHFDFLTRDGQVLRRGASRMLPPVHSEIESGHEAGFFEMTLRRIVELFHVGGVAAEREAACYLEGLIRHLRREGGRPPQRQSGPRNAASSPALADARQRLGEVVRYLRENPAETFRVDALAARAHYSVDHFTRLFTSVYGRAPKTFCIDVRLERARLLLTESELTIDQIARNLGYSDVFFFSRQFKGKVGLPPTAWREAARTRQGRGQS